MKFIFSAEQWLFIFNKYTSILLNAIGNRKKRENPEKILCVKLDEIGDMVTALHVFEHLGNKFPNAEITVLCKPYCVSLIENHPFVNHIITQVEDWNQRYDWVIELRGNRKTLLRSLRYRPAGRADRGTVRMAQRGNQPHERITNFNIIKNITGDLKPLVPRIFTGEQQKQEIAKYIEQEGLQNIYVFHASARRELRRWSASNFALLADYLVQHNFGTVVFIGTPEERPQIEEIRVLMKSHSTAFINQGSLLNLYALMEKAMFFIGNESGPLQMADVAGLPCIGLFGPGVKNVFYPMGKNARVIHHVLECNPCDQIHCVRPDNKCIDMISMAEVLAAHSEILEYYQKNI